MLLAATSCNKEGVIVDDKPAVELDSENGLYTVKVGRELVITPTYENADGALISWSIDGKIVSREPIFRYTWKAVGEVYVKLRVDTEMGTAVAEIKVEVLELTPPVISIVVPAKGLKVLRGTDYTFTPDIQHKDVEGFAIEWVRDGKVVSKDMSYTFNEAELGTYAITVNASNIDGRATKELTLEVVEELPYSVSFPCQSHRRQSTDRYTFSGRPVCLIPRLEYYERPVFAWSVDGQVVSGEEGRMFKFTPSAAGEYVVTCTVTEKTRSSAITRNVTRGSSSMSASVKVTCVGRNEADGMRTGGVSRVSDKVYEYTPAPGQFINETETFGGMTGNETTNEAADKWAAERLKKTHHVSLGSFGGYIIVGFDHSVVNTHGGYDFSVQGNAFEGSSEPGIVWVSQDINGNGEPDDEWYELRGSETGKPETKQLYEVTYFKPAAAGMDVQWVASDGATGCVDYLAQFHKQDYYYPAWVTEPSYTLIGTCLSSRNQLKRPGFWENKGFGWGYVDNMGSDQLPGGNAVNGQGQRNGFKISNAIYADGTPVELRYIDFVKVQCGVLAKSGWLGENSTEVCCFEDLSR